MSRAAVFIALWILHVLWTSLWRCQQQHSNNNKTQQQQQVIISGTINVRCVKGYIFFQQVHLNFSSRKSQSLRAIMTLSHRLSVTQNRVTIFMTGFVTRASITNLDTNLVLKARENPRGHLNSAMNFWTGTSVRRKIMLKTLVRGGEDSWTRSSI